MLKLKGKIVFVESNPGSKSEGRYPYIELDTGDRAKIFALNDNPFQNNLLDGYDGKTVEVEGEFNENCTFIASVINEVVEEAAPAEDEAAEAESTEESSAEVVENKETTEENEENSVENENNTEE